MKDSKFSITTAQIPTVPLNFQESPTKDVQRGALEYYEKMNRRRTVRDYSARNVPIDIIEKLRIPHRYGVQFSLNNITVEHSHAFNVRFYMTHNLPPPWYQCY